MTTGADRIARARELVGVLRGAVTGGDRAAEQAAVSTLRARLSSLVAGSRSAVDSTEGAGTDPGGDSGHDATWRLDDLPPEPAEQVAEAFGRGLVVALHGVKTRGDLDDCAALVDDLRRLEQACPDAPSVRAWRAKGLVDALHVARSAEDLAQRDAWLDALRDLARRHVDEEAMREEYAWGLVNTLYQAAGEPGGDAKRPALLDELEALAADHPAHVMLEAIALVGRLTVHPDQRQSLLERLGRLAAEHPDRPMLAALAAQHGVA